MTAGATWFIAGRLHRHQATAVREEAAAATRAERRARLEEAIARCERGDIASGLERMRASGPTTRCR